MFTSKNNTEEEEEERKGVENKITCSISNLDSISYIILDSTPPLSLPQIILVQTKTMKVALMPNPITVVTKLVFEPNISNHKNQKMMQPQQILQHKQHQTKTPLHRFFNPNSITVTLQIHIRHKPTTSKTKKKKSDLGYEKQRKEKRPMLEKLKLFDVRVIA